VCFLFFTQVVSMAIRCREWIYHMAYCRHVHVKTCTGCNFNTPTSTASKVGQKKMCVFVPLIKKWVTGIYSTELTLNFKCYLGRVHVKHVHWALMHKASTEATKKSSILKWHKWFKQILTLEHDKNVFIQKCINRLNTEKVLNIVFEKMHNNQACLLCRNTDELV
jgi:hypothetical protein